MKLAALVAVLAGCSGDHPAPPPAPTGSAAPVAAPPAAPKGPDLCAAGVRALAAASCTTAAGTATLAQAQKTLTGTLDIARQTSNADPHALQLVCAKLIQALVRDAANTGCKVELASDEDAQLHTVLDAYYAQRTPVVPTGDAAADLVIQRIVKVRDAMCACTDMACVERVDHTIDSIGTFGFDAPQAARDLGVKLLDDVSRCEARLQQR